MNHAVDVGSISIDGRVNRRFGWNRSLARDPFTREIHRTDILRIREHAGKPRVDQKSLGPGNPRAQMPRPGKHALAGDDLDAFDEAPCEILDFRFAIFDV
jgi:hypothetical protein